MAMYGGKGPLFAGRGGGLPSFAGLNASQTGQKAYEYGGSATGLNPEDEDKLGLRSLFGGMAGGVRNATASGQSQDIGKLFSGLVPDVANNLASLFTRRR